MVTHVLVISHLTYGNALYIGLEVATDPECSDKTSYGHILVTLLLCKLDWPLAPYRLPNANQGAIYLEQVYTLKKSIL